MMASLPVIVSSGVVWVLVWLCENEDAALRPRTRINRIRTRDRWIAEKKIEACCH
jgi:hypothetical protein